VELFSDSISAVSLATLSVTGSVARSRAGSVSDSTITLTGNTGPGKVGLGTVTVKGGVYNTGITVQNGNVTSFTAARFLDSKLYAGYQLGVPFDIFGSFTSVQKIGAFKTTGQPVTPGINDLYTTAFRNSEVVAAALGTVRLSSVTIDN